MADAYFISFQEASAMLALLSRFRRPATPQEPSPIYAQLQAERKQREEKLPSAPKEIKEITYANPREAAEAKALMVDLDSIFGLMSDDRLFRLSRTFRHQEIESRHHLCFAEYVKAVASGRWQEYMDEKYRSPPSTILRQYRLKAYQPPKENPWPAVIFAAFVIVICGIFITILF